MNKTIKKIGLGIASLALVASAVVFAPAAMASDPCAGITNPAERAKCGATGVDPQSGGGDENMTTVTKILNTVFVVIGIVAVIMIILGGVSYATSQGDPGKAAKAKNTIMYAIIGLVVVLLAFAIVNFVLQALA